MNDGGTWEVAQQIMKLKWEMIERSRDILESLNHLGFIVGVGFAFLCISIVVHGIITSVNNSDGQ